MRAFLVAEPGKYGMAEVPDPVPGPGEVLVAPAGVGICSSDLELLEGSRPACYVHYPVVPGHEWAGRVLACGAGVAALEPGQPVVAEGVRVCGTCARCREGRANICAGPYAETGFTHPGALAERLVVPAALVHALPADRPVAEAALLEPAGCIASGLLELGLPEPGAAVAVVGDGPLGLLAVLLAKLTSPGELVMVGHRPKRLVTGRACGATEAVCDRDGGLEALRGGFDLVIEAPTPPPGR